MKKIVLLTALLCLLIAVQSTFAYTEPQPYTNLTYNGSLQFLTSTGQGDSSDEQFVFMDNKGEWNLDRTPAQYPGTYTVKYCLAEIETKPYKCTTTPRSISVKIKESNAPQPISKSGLVYNGSDQFLIKPGKAEKNDVYYYRITSPASQKTSWRKYEKSPEDDYALPRAKDPNTYTVEYLLWPKTDENGDNIMPSDNVKGTPLSITIKSRGSSDNSNSNSGSSGGNHYTFYNVGDGSALFSSGNTLPATGFPTRISKPLSIKPDSVFYEDLSMRIQIPSISVDVELTGVPVLGDTWAVEWLGNEAGMLSGSAMPGEGYTMVAAHNHLNTQEIGPFGFLFDLDENDRIFVNMPDGDLKIYSVYANELLEPNDFTQIASISENEEGSLILVTCENEMTDGNYQNRRVVFAKLMN